MSALRLLVTAGIAAAVAVLGAGMAERRPAPPAVLGAAAPGARAEPVPGPPAPDRERERPRASPAPRSGDGVPPGILSRAAAARALDRGACADQGREGAACDPPAGPVEIDWDVRPEP